MKTRFLLVGALAVASLLAPLPAFANSAVMCQGDVSGASSGARTIGGTGSAMPSGLLYTLNAQGCAVVGSSDIGFFASQGFTNSGGGLTSLVFSSQTTGFQFSIPQSAFIRNLVVQEISGNTYLPGLNFGSTNGGSDVAKMAGTASTLTVASDASLAKRVITATGSQPIFVTGTLGVGWSTSVFNFTIEYGYL